MLRSYLLCIPPNNILIFKLIAPYYKGKLKTYNVKTKFREIWLLDSSTCTYLYLLRK